MQSGVFTMLPTLVANIPPATMAVGSQNGIITANGCRLIGILDKHWRVIRCGKDPVLHGSPPIAISEIASHPSRIRRTKFQGKAGMARIIASSPTYIHARIAAARGSVIVLRELFNKGWRINLAGTRHVMVDGYANGWILSHDYSGSITLYYEPQNVYLSALLCSSATLIFALAMGVANKIRATRMPPSGA